MSDAAILNKDAIITAIAAEAEMTKAQAEKALNATLGAVKAALVRGDSVRLHNVGTLSVKQVGERAGRNPKTGEAITIPARREVKFAVSKDLKEAVVAG